LSSNHLHIIEDSLLTLHILTNSLEEIYSISVSSDRREFIDFLKRGTSPDIYLIDITLPDIDGFEILKILKGTSSAKIIYSAKTNPELIEKAFELGAHDFIKKPTPVQELKARLSKTLLFFNILKDNKLNLEEVKGTIAHYFGQPLTALGAELYTLKKSLPANELNDSAYSSIKRFEQAFEILVEMYNKFKDIDTPVKVDYLNNKKILDLNGDR